MSSPYTFGMPAEPAAPVIVASGAAAAGREGVSCKQAGTLVGGLVTMGPDGQGYCCANGTYDPASCTKM